MSLLRAGHDWLRTHDPGYGALRRAVRAAILMPALFAFADKVIANPTMAYFIAFGSFAMLLLVDFSGPIVDRLRAQASLGVACAVLISLGTLVSRSTAASVILMALVAFAILFAGVVSSTLAGATTALLLAFILPVSLPGPASQIPDRVAGWGLAAFVSLFAISLLWPAPARNPVRQRAIDACRAVCARLRAHVAFMTSEGGKEAYVVYEAAIGAADTAVGELQKLFFATPYRPTGLATDARAMIRLVDELRWLNTIVLRSAPKRHMLHPDRAVCAVKLAAADVMDELAASARGASGAARPLHGAREQLRDGLLGLDTARRRRSCRREWTASSRPWTRASARRSWRSSSVRSRPTPSTRRPPSGAAGSTASRAASRRGSPGL